MAARSSSTSAYTMWSSMYGLFSGQTNPERYMNVSSTAPLMLEGHMAIPSKSPMPINSSAAVNTHPSGRRITPDVWNRPAFHSSGPAVV